MTKGRPPIWIRAGYYLLGTRVPKMWLDWVSDDIDRSAWHKWVPRLRITVVLVVAIVAFAGPWTPLWPVVTVALLAIVLLLWVGSAGDGDDLRKRELMFQNRVAGWESRLNIFIAPLSMASASGGDYESSGAPPAETHTAEPADPAGSGIQTTCRWCGETIQREGDAWHHRDTDWILFECPECGWQDVEAMTCPACGKKDLIKTTEPGAAPRRRLLYLSYVAGFVAIAVWWILIRILRP